MADRSGSRKHKWSSPAEMSPSKYLRGLDSKLPRSAHHSRERDSESLSPPRERQVTICPYESTPKRTLNLGAGGSSKERLQSRGHPSSDYHRSDRQATSTQRISVSEGDRRVEMDEDAKAKSADVPRSRERRPHAPSLLFKRAFSDILGVSSRERRSLVGQTMSSSDTERRSRFQRRDSTSSEASPKMGTPEDQIEEEKPSRRWDSADRPIRLHRTITRDLPKEEPEVCKEKTDTPVREVEEEKPPRRRDAEDHQIRINRTIAREFPKEEAKVCKEKSKGSKSLPTNIVEGKPAESADHPVQLRRPIKRVFANEEPEVHKGKSTHSEPIQRTGDSKNVIVEEEPSGSKEHPVRVRKSITRADPNEEPEAHREKSRHSEPSSRTRTTSKNEEAKLSWRSEIGDHPIRLKGAIEKAVPKKESEAYKGTSRDSDPSPRTGTSKNEDVKPSRRSESGDHPIRLKGAIEKAVPIKESEAYKGTSRGTDPSPRTGSSKNKDVKPSRRSESADHPVKLKRLMKKAVPKEEPEVPADIPRLVFLYESDKESDASDHLEKNPSIGSDFSDIDDMGTLARFSQEDAPLQDGAPTPSCLRHPQQLYSRPFNSHTDLWPTSPMYKPSTEQNKWRQDDLNKSCLSEVSVNTERSRMTSSDSEDEDEKRPGRTESFYTQWILNETTKAPRRTLDFPPASDCNTPKFLREGFIDTHCHLDMLFSRLQHKRSFADLCHQYSSTFPSEFQGCITDYCDPRTLERLPWRHVLNEKMVWGAFGCHPHFAQYYTNELQEDMMQAMRHPKAIAYGEMGLDYSHKCSTTIPDQHAVFEKQLKLAVPLGKPLVIHCRDADEDLFRIMKKWVPPDYKIHRHCFTGDYKVIEPFLHEFPNMSVGFTAVLTYPSAASAREAVTRIPLDRLIIETDAPFFVPRQVPKSLCKFSHPGLALHTVQEVARLKNLPLRSVMAKVRENTHRLYNI